MKRALFLLFIKSVSSIVFIEEITMPRDETAREVIVRRREACGK